MCRVYYGMVNILKVWIPVKNHNGLIMKSFSIINTNNNVLCDSKFNSNFNFVNLIKDIVFSFLVLRINYCYYNSNHPDHT